MNKKIFTLLILLLLLPVTALAADGIELYVGGQLITESGCYEKNQDGNWTKVGSAEPASGQFYYDAATATLTLNEAKIVNYQDVTVGGGFTYPGSVIAFSQSADVSLTIVVSQGTSNITGTGGIRVVSKAGDASLSISGPGSLEVNVDKNDSGISLIGSKNVNLNIDGADVKTLAAYYYGVDLHAGDGFKAAAVVNNGKLTAGGSGGIGIYYRWTNPSDSGTSSLTVSGNAVVDTRDSKILIASQASEVQVSAGSDGNGGIVFDGKSGTVYGDVTLQEDLEIGTDETLTIPEGSSLDSNGKLTNEGTIINEGTLIGEVGGSGTVTPKITTDSLSDGTVGESYTAKLQATGNNITWSASGLPDGLTLNENTGTISGTPTKEGTFNFTVTATNSAGNASKEYTLNIKSATVPVTGVTLDKTTLELFTGNTATLTATVQPSDATNQNVTWESSNTEVATVGANGKVTAVGEGNATITATAADGSGKFATCEVTVVHTWGDVSYTWSKDDEGNQTCTATRTCENNALHTESATATVTGVQTKAPTCTEMGETTYTATFSVDWAEEQTKTVMDIPATGHHYVNGYCTECGHRDPDYRPDPISYYNIYVEDVCDGVEVSTSKQVVREGGSISVYVEKDTANYTFDNFKVYYKRSYYGGWEELKEGTQPGEYPIKNIWTHIYIKAEGAEEKEDPTGIESIEGVKVYTKDGSLYVQTPQREQVIIVSMSGAIVKNEEQIGLKQYHGLQPGIYIVRVGDKAYKVRLN